jgi:bifunctional oligoribonuclease and PAP phosphatase NrnA
MSTVTSADILARIRDEVRTRQRFLITSHQRPDGDSIGSQLAMAHALWELGKDAEVVNRDAAPTHYRVFPGVADIRIAGEVTGEYDAVFVMECGDLARTGLGGLDRFFIINIDHHVGNAGYGAINWFDGSASACGEMVYDLTIALGVPLTRAIATHVYLAILTDTGSFHHSNITAKTFEICRRTVEAGVNPARIARSVFDSNSFGKLKLIGSLLDSMQLEHGGRLAILYLDDQMLRDAGCTHNDTEGLINLPLTAREIQAVVFFKVLDGQLQVSLRSKDQVDVREVARRFGGGGHKNASGFTATTGLAEVQRPVIDQLARAIESEV